MANTKITNPELFNLGDSTSATQLPVMTTTQRTAMTGLSVGEMIFNSTTDKVEYFDGTKWYGITYEFVYPTGLEMNLDASNTTSYPGTGTTWFDLTSNNNNGAINGATWNATGYFSFDGSNDYVQISPIPSTVQSDTIITGEAWINPTTATNNTIISFRGGGGSSVKFFFAANSSGQLYLASASTSNFVSFGTTSSNSVPVGSWSHVVASINYTSKTYTIYINETLASSGSQSNIRAASTFGATNFFIGTNLIGVQHSNLKISQARLYNTALTQAEVTALFLKGKGF